MDTEQTAAAQSETVPAATTGDLLTDTRIRRELGYLHRGMPGWGAWQAHGDGRWTGTRTRPGPPHGMTVYVVVNHQISWLAFAQVDPAVIDTAGVWRHLEQRMREEDARRRPAVVFADLRHLQPPIPADAYGRGAGAVLDEAKYAGREALFGALQAALVALVDVVYLPPDRDDRAAKRAALDEANARVAEALRVGGPYGSAQHLAYLAARNQPPADDGEDQAVRV